jgi:hypothetical protein
MPRDYAGLASQCLEAVERGARAHRDAPLPDTLGDLSGVPCSALWKGMNMIGRVES